MTNSNGTGETTKREPREKKSGMVATITAVTALLTAGGTLVKGVQGRHEQELIQKSVFNYATAQTAEIRERLAKIEAHVEWLRGRAELTLPPVARGSGCETDQDCQAGHSCVGGKCSSKATVGMGGGAGAGSLPMEKPVSPRSPKRPEKFEDLKDYVQVEQRAWPAD